jgi:hypothetical protein
MGFLLPRYHLFPEEGYKNFKGLILIPCFMRAVGAAPGS